MRFLIVTGMSGAGKSTGLKILEDFGFYCVDHLPMELLPEFSSWALRRPDHDRIALGLDVRNGEDVSTLADILNTDSLVAVEPEILYFDASDECLIKRFKETRRSHPLEKEVGHLDGAIELERKRLSRVREKTKYFLDTSYLLTRDLRSQLSDIFMKDKMYKNLNVTIQSFGFKYGVPAEADLVFDVRFLPNPYYVDELKEKTGNDAEVAAYVMNSEISREFLNKLIDMVDFLLPNYVAEGKNQLVIAIGCTGGRHRSVTVANALYNAMKNQGYGLKLIHPHI